MDELRNRFRKLMLITENPIRQREHTTFNRLLYKNRNQHRHGLYFRRLEHVRRLLRKVTEHVVWKSTRHALGDEGVKPGRKTKQPLSLSSITVNDLQSVEASLSILVDKVVPKAAIKITTELVSREHFLPFAITVVAILARLYVIERKLLSEVRGAIIEAKLILGINISQNLQKDQSGAEPHVAEDIGAEVPINEGSIRGIREKDIKRLATSTPTAAAAVSAQPDTDTVPRIDGLTKNYQQTIQASVNLEASKAPPEKTPSLYEVMAKYNKGAAATAQSQTGSIIVDIASATLEKSCPLPTVDSKSLLYSKKRNEVEVPEAAGHREQTQGQTDTNKNRKLLSNENKRDEFGRLRGCDLGKAENEAKVATRDSDSDSEDIDDIFGALDD